jgi:hypothetical protein
MYRIVFFQIFFWLHQVLFGLPSLWCLFALIVERVKIEDVIGVFLFWIGGTLTWGFTCLMSALVERWR